MNLTSYTLTRAGNANGIWDGREDEVHFFELQLDFLPELRLDTREIIDAHFALPEELPGIAVTAAVAAYLDRDLA